MLVPASQWDSYEDERLAEVITDMQRERVAMKNLTRISPRGWLRTPTVKRHMSSTCRH